VSPERLREGLRGAVEERMSAEGYVH
jgi:hypothetical protein